MNNQFKVGDRVRVKDGRSLGGGRITGGVVDSVNGIYIRLSPHATRYGAGWEFHHFVLDTTVNEEKKYQVRNQTTNNICLNHECFSWDDVVIKAKELVETYQRNYEIVRAPADPVIVAEVVYHPASVTVDEVNSR